MTSTDAARTNAITRAADQHALIVASDGLWAPSGLNFTGEAGPLWPKSPTNIQALLGSIQWWAKQNGARNAGGVNAQVWLTDDACAALGWGPDTIDLGISHEYEGGFEDAEEERTTILTRLDEQTKELLSFYIREDTTSEGWSIFIPRYDGHLADFEPAATAVPPRSIGPVLHLTWHTGKGEVRVDVVLTAFMWTHVTRDQVSVLGNSKKGTNLDQLEDEAAWRTELGRRLAVVTDTLGVLPAWTGAATGAALLNRIYDDRLHRARKGARGSKATPQGVVVTTATPLPEIGVDQTEIEPEERWARYVTNADMEVRPGDALGVVTSIDQRKAYLASAGMLTLGWGKLTLLAGEAAHAAAAQADAPIPFGLWHVTLPAMNDLLTRGVPAELPPPHPHILPDQTVSTWITTPSLELLCAGLEVGGAGLDLIDLAIEEALVTEHQGKALETWKDCLAEGFKTAGLDAALNDIFKDIYSSYIGRISTDKWSSTRRQKIHEQPLWRAAIIAHTRARNRAKAIKIHDRTGLWPIAGTVDSWQYIAPDEVLPLDDSKEGYSHPKTRAFVSTADRLGKFVTEAQTEFTDEVLVAFASAERPPQVRQVLRDLFGEADDELTDSTMTAGEGQ